ncbi:alpha/beta hydrolase [Acidicapsa acidisoli]|uniref:alpha/beta hydrolase n=1 Tax=Acidicapsa acidisoli TaxID=1615681 RepID=UPI0021DF7956|nr:alpha/beta hydrolase [Acidicapsa acidisoli]
MSRVFTIAITCISRALVLRDRLMGRIGSGRLSDIGDTADTSDALVSRHAIRSGKNVLDAFFVRPAAVPVQSVVLICHGIGETVEHWLPVQRLLAANGAASLVFDYSGYGRSTGSINVNQCERDAIAAFELLCDLMPGFSVSLLGYSLGSGVAAAIIGRVAAERLVLCAAFTSFREAACSIGIPKRFAFAVPHVWKAEEALRDCEVPVLIVHGERDQLFPVRMASELNAFCGWNAEVVLVPEVSHNEPFYQPDLSYWGLILSRLAIARLVEGIEQAASG